MKKISLLAGMLILSLLLFYVNLPALSLQKEEGNTKSDVLVEIFKHTETAPYFQDIQAWSRVDILNPSRKMMKEAVYLAVRELEGGIVEEEFHQENDFSSFTVTADLEEDALLYAAAQKVDEKCYLVLNIQGTGFKNAASYERKIYNYFAYYNVEPKLGITLACILPGRLSQKEQHELILSIFERERIRVIDGVTAGNVVSLSGYSPLLGEGLAVGKRIINLNIACRVSPEGNSTIVYAGTPLITCEY